MYDSPDMALWIRMADWYYVEIAKKLNEIYINHFLYGKSLSSTYDKIFREVTEGNICRLKDGTDKSTNYLDVTQCEEILGGTCTQGLFMVMTHYKAFLNSELRKYATINNTYWKTNLFTDKCNDELNTDEVYYYMFIFPDILKPALKYLQKSLKISLNEFIDSLINIETFAFALFLLGIVVFQIIYIVTVYQENSMVFLLLL